MAYKLLFLDTETTGNETKDYLCQVAWSDGKNRHSALFKPPVPISYESMAVHHITNKMVADKPAFKFSTEHAEVAKRFADEETVFIAHNAIFDLGMLAKEGLVPQNISAHSESHDTSIQKKNIILSPPIFALLSGPGSR